MTPLPESETEIEARRLASRFGVALLATGLGGIAALVWLLFAFLQAPLASPFMLALQGELRQRLAAVLADEPMLQMAGLYAGIMLYLLALGIGVRIVGALIAAGSELLRGSDLNKLLEALKRREP